MRNNEIIMKMMSVGREEYKKGTEIGVELLRKLMTQDEEEEEVSKRIKGERR